jgi:thiol:disulfide interchange protein DsbD
MRIFRQIPILFAALILPVLADAQLYNGQQLIRPELIAAVDAIVPGSPITVAIRLRPEPGWHTYWQYPGDAGISTTAIWSLPPSFSSGPIQWPVPRLDNEPGGLQTYAYDDILLPVTIQVPSDLLAGQSVTLKVHCAWLVCRQLCVPGKADLAITLPVALASHPANSGLFAHATSFLPRSDAPPFHAAWSRDGTNLLLTLNPPLRPLSHAMASSTSS